MTERSRNIMVGLTAMAGLAAIAVLLVLFGYAPKLFDKSYTVTVEMPDSGGVNNATRVWLHGIDIGQVDSVDLLPPPKRGVTMALAIRPEVRLPMGMQVHVERALLAGSPALVVDLDKITDDKDLTNYLPVDGKAFIRVTSATPTFEDRVAVELRSALQNAINKFTDQLAEPKKRLDDISQKFGALSDQWVKVGQSINELVEKRSPQDVDQGHARGNLASVLARTDERLAELKVTIAGLDKWANDPKMREDFQKTLDNAAKASGKLDDTLAKVQQLSTDASGNIDKLTRRLVGVADDLSVAIGSMRTTLDQINSGKGTAGKLINDPAVYDNLNDSIIRIGKTLDDLRMLIDKWKKEGLPLKF